MRGAVTLYVLTDKKRIRKISTILRGTFHRMNVPVCFYLTHVNFNDIRTYLMFWFVQVSYSYHRKSRFWKRILITVIELHGYCYMVQNKPMVWPVMYMKLCGMEVNFISGIWTDEQLKSSFQPLPFFIITDASPKRRVQQNHILW